MDRLAATLDAILGRYEASVAAAFRRAMATWRANADAEALVRALSNNDVAAAIAALHLDPAALNAFLDELDAAFRASGSSTASTFPRLRSPATGARFIIGFNARDPRAQAWLLSLSSRLITSITEAARDAVRIILEAGLAAGQGPATVALDVVGRIGPGGARQGGVIGLSAPQARFLASARLELSSTDPALLRNYLGRALRDRRFDSYVERAIADGSPIPADARDRALVSYANRLLQLRGETVARTELLPALHTAQNQAVRQAIDTGAVASRDVRKTWYSAHDASVRDSHRELDGTSVPFGDPFVSPLSGQAMMYPGDTSLGAGPEEVVNCRCIASTRVNFFAGVR